MWIMRYTTVHSQHYIHNTHGEYWWILCMCVYVRVRGHGNMRSQMKPQRDGRSGIWAHGKEKGGGGWGSQFDMINHVQQGGRQNQFDMIDHGSCVRPALNSFFWLAQCFPCYRSENMTAAHKLSILAVRVYYIIDPIYFDPAKMEKFVWIVWCCQTG